MPEYSPMDWQLLAELSLAVHQKQFVPFPLLRLLATRGWVHEPHGDDGIRIHVYRSSDGGPLQPLLGADYLLGAPSMTRAGDKELKAFRAEYDMDDVEDILRPLDEEDAEDLGGMLG